MKKLAILLGAIALTGSTFAQKATLDNPWSLEGAVSFGGSNGITWTAPSIRARYFVNENIAVRVSLGLGDGLGTPQSESRKVASAPGETTAGTVEISRMSWNAQIGGEYHLKGTERMSPFFMLGINFGSGSSTAKTQDTDGTTYIPTLTTETKGGFGMFGVALGAGMDFYVFENMYVGFELGLSYSNYNYKDVTTTKTISMLGGDPVTTTSTTLGYSKSYLSTAAGNTALRLGWRF